MVGLLRFSGNNNNNKKKRKKFKFPRTRKDMIYCRVEIKSQKKKIGSKTKIMWKKSPFVLLYYNA